MFGASILCTTTLGVPSVGGNIENFAGDGDVLCPKTRQKDEYIPYKNKEGIQLDTHLSFIY